MNPTFSKGDKVRVVERKNKFGEGLHYKAGIYTMLEDGCMYGADVWDCIDPSGEETSIYGFSIEEVVECEFTKEGEPK